MKIMEYECAVVETLLDNETRSVSFELDPFTLMRALAQRRLSDVAEIDSGCPVTRAGVLSGYEPNPDQQRPSKP